MSHRSRRVGFFRSQSGEEREEDPQRSSILAEASGLTNLQLARASGPSSPVTTLIAYSVICRVGAQRPVVDRRDCPSMNSSRCSARCLAQLLAFRKHITSRLNLYDTHTRKDNKSSATTVARTRKMAAPQVKEPLTHSHQFILLLPSTTALAQMKAARTMLQPRTQNALTLDVNPIRSNNYRTDTFT